MNAPMEQLARKPEAASDGGRLQRVSVVGNTGSGKTTFAAALARRLGSVAIELDAMHWGANWTPLDTDHFRQQLVPRLEEERWVTDGNYQKVRDLVWARADTVVWLDYSLLTCLGRLARRTYRRVRGREELWNGNRERLRDHLLSRDSLFLWLLQTHGRHRREFVEWLNMPAYAHLTLVRFRTPGEAERWLDTCGHDATGSE